MTVRPPRPLGRTTYLPWVGRRRPAMWPGDHGCGTPPHLAAPSSASALAPSGCCRARRRLRLNLRQRPRSRSSVGPLRPTSTASSSLDIPSTRLAAPTAPRPGSGRPASRRRPTNICAP